MRRNAPTDRETKNWSETRWLGTWNPDAGVGVYLHAGRFRHDVDLWWAQTIVYLPEGRIAVDRSWCPFASARRPWDRRTLPRFIVALASN